jgi:hypothetical protein
MTNVFNVRVDKPDVELLMQGVAERLRRFEMGEGSDDEVATAKRSSIPTALSLDRRSLLSRRLSVGGVGGS